EYTAWRANRRPARSFTAEAVEAFVASPQGGRDRQAEREIERALEADRAVPLGAEKFARPTPGVVHLEQSMRELVGKGRFLSSTYEAAPDRRTLRVYAEPKPYLPSLLYLSPSIEASEYLGTRAFLNARLVRYDPVGYGSEARLDLNLGSRNALDLEIYRPLAGRFFGAARLQASMEPWEIYGTDGKAGTLRRESLGAGIDFGLSVGNRMEARLSFDAGKARTLRSQGDASLEAFDGPESFASFRLKYDGLDRAMVPTSGALASLDARAYLETPAGSQGVRRLQGSGAWFLPVGNGSFFSFARAGTVFDDADPSIPFRLGGLFQMSAFAPDEMLAQKYALGGVGYMRQVGKLPLGLAAGTLRLGAWAEYARVERFPVGIYRGWSFSFGGFAESPVGPVFLGMSTDAERRHRLQFRIGRLF
ncbi:MAG TPA: BamA/TamA family outer membrane protein, partial [Fimbriimonas sp.]